MTKGKGSLRVLAGISIVFLSAGLFSPSALAGVDESERRQKVIDHWTPERRAAAQPRDMVIDHRGLGYIRRADGSLQPHGHQISAEKAGAPTPNARPGGNDGIAPVVGAMDPNGTTIGASYTFSATVTDNVGLKSVTFVIVYPGGSQTQSFTASNSGGDTWTVSLQGFSDGAWGWYVVAKDTATKGGNTTTSATVPFTVDTSGGGGGGGGGGDWCTTSRQTRAHPSSTAIEPLQSPPGDRARMRPIESTNKRRASTRASPSTAPEPTTGRYGSSSSRLRAESGLGSCVARRRSTSSGPPHGTQISQCHPRDLASPCRRFSQNAPRCHRYMQERTCT
ncbi:MAG: hypothetical protein ABFR53_07270 [Actinomycetota bacterium]